MDLKIFKRISLKKGTSKDLRRKNNIPAVLYTPGKENENIYINKDDFNKILAKIKKDRLSTTVFSLKTEDNKSIKAIVKDIQYHIISYKVIHIDFQGLVENRKVNLKVPIECIGEENCPGIKLGGALRQALRKVKIKCLPKDIPSEFIVDIKDLNILEKILVKGIEMPKGVELVTSENQVAALIAKR